MVIAIIIIIIRLNYIELYDHLYTSTMFPVISR